MKIDNETKYDTKYLRRLFKECEKHIFQTYLVHGESKHRYISVKTHRARWIGGFGFYHSVSLRIKLPSPVSTHLGHIKRTNEVSARRVAQVYLHEVAHNLGKRHKQMTSAYKIDVSWWPDELVPVKQVVVKPKPNIIEVRAAKAQKKLDEWLRKTKRAKTLVKKYQRKVKYYEKKAAASKS